MESMATIFNGANSFNQDISKWNVAGLTYMNAMFQGASAFNQNLYQWGLLLNHISTDGGNLNSNGWDIIFKDTSCDTVSSPNLGKSPPGPFCHSCDEV